MLTKNQFSQSLCFLSRITILISFIFIFNSCEDVGVDFNETLPNPIVNAEELKIYGLVLEQINTNSLMVIRDTTIANDDYNPLYDSFDNFVAEYSRLQKETYDDFVNPFSKRRIFKNLPYDTKHNLVLLSQHPWQHNEPGVHGLIFFSNIAFNKSKTQALLSIGDYKAALNAYGFNAILEKKNDEWIIIKKFRFWIS